MFILLLSLLAAASAQSICEKWMQGKPAAITTQAKLVEAVVVGVFTEITKDNDTVKLFNGQVPCMSKDFVANTANQGALVTGLVAYFGVALGCNETDYPKYTGSLDMQAVHKNMPINKRIFDQFITTLVNTVKASLNATLVPSLDADLTAVGGVLTNDVNGKICNQADCTIPTKGTYEAKTCDAATTGAGTTGAGTTGAAGACKGLACADCVKNTACAWCDSVRAGLEKVGSNSTLSSGSCSTGSCTAGEKVKFTTCSNAIATVLSVAAVVVAAFLAL
jgi:hypothetical protein